MTPERWQQITAVFHNALEHDGDRRGRFLDEVCGADAALRREVDALLDAHHGAGQFGDSPVHVDPAETPDKGPLHPVVWLVGLVAIATAATFAYAAYILVVRGGSTTVVGWTEGKRQTGWHITAVDPSGPAAGRLTPGDRVVSLNQIPPILDAGTLLARRSLSPGETYEAAIERDGEQRSYTLDTMPGPSALASRVTYFLVSLVWCAVGLFIAFARPGERVARLAAAGAVSAGLVFLQVGVIQSGPLWQPLHMVLGYHFFTRFPTGRAPGGFWRAGLWVMYIVGGIPAIAGLWLHATLLTQGIAGVADLVSSRPALFDSRFALGIVAGALASVGMIAVIPYTYRRLETEDQRRRVRWMLFGSLVGLAPQLWWSGVALYGLLIGPASVSQLSVLVNAFTVAIPLSAAYAVVRHRVFDISVVVRLGVQYLLARRALQVLAAVPLAALAYTVVVNRHRTIAELVTESTGYIYWVAAGALALRFRRPIRTWLDRRFFREEYDREHMLLGLVDDLGKVDTIPALSELVRSKLDVALHPSSIVLWYRDPGEHASASASNPLLTPLDFPSGGAWLSWLEERGSGADVPLPAAAGLSRRESQWLADRGVTLAVPIADSADRLAGVLLLGAKKSEERYSAGDRRLLQAIASQTGVVRENLRLRSQVSEEQRIRRDVLARLDGTLTNLLKECPLCGACYDSPAERCDRDGQALTLTLPIARTVDGKYRLDELIGKGGMGAVYAARDLRLDRSVAVKILPGRAFGEQAALRRFRREARAAAQLNHPHIVGVYDYGALEGEGAYIVMERVHGVTLRAELERITAMRPADAADWFDQMLAGLAAAHAQGIVHRDLKPENVIGQRGQRDAARGLTVKILDFGLAKVAAMDGDAPGSGTMTAAGLVMGTVGYMSPEQLLGSAVDQRTDIFAVGVMVAEALTGRRPFQGENVAQAVLRNEYHLPLASPGMRAIDEVLQKCLTRDPAKRLSAAELRAELVPLLRACPPQM